MEASLRRLPLAVFPSEAALESDPLDDDALSPAEWGDRAASGSFPSKLLWLRLRKTKDGDSKLKTRGCIFPVSCIHGTTAHEEKGKGQEGAVVVVVVVVRRCLLPDYH